MQSLHPETVVPSSLPSPSTNGTNNNANGTKNTSLEKKDRDAAGLRNTWYRFKTPSEGGGDRTGKKVVRCGGIHEVWCAEKIYCTPDEEEYGAQQIVMRYYHSKKCALVWNKGAGLLRLS